jgi:Fe2+ or Zn2+ uptake regulation protein
MERDLLERLEQADRRVTLGERHVERQREIIAELERNGRDSTQARELLAVFLATQATHVSWRDRLLEELKTKQS